MGLLNLARRKRFLNYSMADFDRDIRTAITGRMAKSGVKVNEQTALKFTAVWACIRLISETLATVPLKVYRKRRSSVGRDEATDYPLYDVLHSKPNDEMPAVTYRETVQAHILQCGNGYSFPALNRRGQIIELYPIPWTQIYPRRNLETRQIEYVFIDRDKQEILPREKVFHIPGLGFDGIQGYSPIAMHMETVGIGLAQEEFTANFYGQGANIGGILTVAGLGNRQDREKLREEIEEKFSGLGKSHRLMVLADGSQYHRIAMPLAEAQYIETRDFQIVDIARIYNLSVALHLLGVHDKAATYSSVEQFAIAYIVYVIRPWAVRWEQYINAFLLTREERAQGYYAEHNLDALLRGDSKTRAEVLQIWRKMGIINGDEWRGLENMNPLPDGKGEIIMVDQNLIPIELAGMNLKNKSKGGEKING